MEELNRELKLEEIRAFVFDMDGVITETASVHASAWKQIFDEFLRRRAEKRGETFVPFDIETDYRLYVDGKPRYDGVKSFVNSRGIKLPYGKPSDAPEKETVCGLGNRKNRFFLKVLQEQGAKAFDSSVRFVKDLKRRGVHVALISASRNGRDVLKAANVLSLFEQIVDGVDADRLKLKGKPAPDIFIEAARQLGFKPEYGRVDA